MLQSRHHFPGLLDKVYLDAACISVAPRPAVEAIGKFLDFAMLCSSDSATAHHILMDNMRAAARPTVARLINAHDDEIALVESTTHGLSIAANSIPLQPGDRVLMSDLEFMEVAIPWVYKKKDGIEIDVVPHRNGEVRVQDFADRLTPRTRVVALSTVQWTNGYRCGLAAFSKLCRERRIPVQARLESAFGFERPNEDWHQLEKQYRHRYLRHTACWRRNAFLSASRVYESCETANYPGAVGLAASLKLIQDLGQQNIADHIYSLTNQYRFLLEMLHSY
jgi:selenocysteine lyase/cysteine desulfurase